MTKAIKKIKIILPSIIILSLFLIQNCTPDEPEVERKETFLEGKQFTDLEWPFTFGQLGSTISFQISPDRTMLLFEAPFGTDSIQYGLNILHIQPKKITHLYQNTNNPDWSPDSKWIVFGSGRSLYKIKINKDSLTLLDDSKDKGGNFFPDWSPNEHTIAYDRSISDEYGKSGIWLMNKNGTNRTWVFSGVEPIWHPTEPKILATALNHKVITYDLKTKVITRIFSERIPENLIGNISYSPDGKRIVYSSQHYIWIANADGSAAKRILPSAKLEGTGEGRKLQANFPTWAADSKHILYRHTIINKWKETFFGMQSEGVISIYHVNVDSALLISNL